MLMLTLQEPAPIDRSVEDFNKRSPRSALSDNSGISTVHTLSTSTRKTLLALVYTNGVRNST